ncbi:MAG: type II toxin-antitoxin system prevent-host-death family antitoxin [Propionibacteriaceae bacterium]|jgi:prevent-host-death family protein|nr:type II toxin-antitoxin system prevent-host-death family antitoxin [Propionibacteriaceae bacterium]
MSITVGAYEAKTRFSELLDRVVHGETITVSRHGTPVARLAPLGEPEPAEGRRAAAEIRRLRAGLRLDGLTIRELMDEGRR